MMERKLITIEVEVDLPEDFDAQQDAFYAIVEAAQNEARSRGMLRRTGYTMQEPRR